MASSGPAVGSAIANGFKVLRHINTHRKAMKAIAAGPQKPNKANVRVTRPDPAIVKRQIKQKVMTVKKSLPTVASRQNGKDKFLPINYLHKHAG